MEKNIRSDFVQLRESRGFKTKKSLMRAIEEHCKKNGIPSFKDKTLQRMEKHNSASENTIKIISAVLNISEENLKLTIKKKGDVKKSFVDDIPLERFSEIPLIRLSSLKSKYFKKYLPLSTKRKVIMDIGDTENDNQFIAAKRFIYLLDKLAKEEKDIVKLVESDSFGSYADLQKKVNLEDELQKLLDGLQSGYKFEIEEETETTDFICYPNPNKRKQLNPIYIYYGTHPYVTYWPFPKMMFEDKMNFIGVFKNHFDGIKFTQKDTGFTYDPDEKNNYVLCALSNMYSFFILSRHPNLEKITYKNQVSKIILEDQNIIRELIKDGTIKDADPNFGLERLENSGVRIIGKTVSSQNYNQLLKSIKNQEPLALEGPGVLENLPNNLLEDFTFIYGAEDKFNFDNGMPRDPDDWLVETNNRIEKCYEIIINDSRFYNLVKYADFLEYFKITDNIDQKSRESWVKKRGFRFETKEMISQLLSHYDYDINKTTETILEGGNKLDEELKKSKPITIEDI